MSEREKAYEHESTVTGTGSPGERPSTEHLDTASGDAEDRNELAPERRARPDGDGPRTHEDTKVVRKDGE